MSTKLRVYAPGLTVKALIAQDDTHWAAGAMSPSIVADSSRTTSEWQSDLIVLSNETNGSSVDNGWRSANIPGLPVALPETAPYRVQFFDATGGTPAPGDAEIAVQEFYWDGAQIYEFT